MFFTGWKHTGSTNMERFTVYSIYSEQARQIFNEKTHFYHLNKNSQTDSLLVDRCVSTSIEEVVDSTKTASNRYLFKITRPSLQCILYVNKMAGF